MPIWCRLFMQAVCRPFARARDRAGNSSAARIAMMAITTSSSIRVKAQRYELAPLFAAAPQLPERLLTSSHLPDGSFIWLSLLLNELRRFKFLISPACLQENGVSRQQFSLWSFYFQGGEASNWRWVAGRCRWPGECEIGNRSEV